MRAATLHGIEDIRVEDVPDPTLSSEDDAIVRIVSSAVCGTDLWLYRWPDGTTGAQPMGHECLGEVVAVGRGLSDLRTGDFVVVPFVHCDSICSRCRAGVHSACDRLGFTETGQAEFCRVRNASGTLLRLDGDPGAELYSRFLVLADVLPTGWHAATSANVQPGSTVVVVGDGSVGLCGVLAAREMGAERIIVMSRHPDRQQVALRHGSTDFVEARGADGEAEVLDLTAGKGADAVLECVGTDMAVRTAIAVAAPGAMVGSVGVPHGVRLQTEDMYRRNIGIRGGLTPVQRYLPRLSPLVASGDLDASAVFDVALSLEDAALGYRAMDSRSAIKVQLNP